MGTGPIRGSSSLTPLFSLGFPHCEVDKRARKKGKDRKCTGCGTRGCGKRDSQGAGSGR